MPTVVIRGDLAGRELIAFWLSATGIVMAAVNVFVWDVEAQITARWRVVRST